MNNARFRVPNIKRDVRLAKFLEGAGALLLPRNEFDFERMIFLESAHAENAETYDAAVFAYTPHHGIALRGPHIALGVTKGYFEVIRFRVEAQLHFIAHHFSPMCSEIGRASCRERV